MRSPSLLVAVLAVAGLAQEIPGDLWQARDLEGRWVVVERSLNERPEALEEWCTFLVKSKDFELLEWLALYREAYGPVQALHAARAPQWVRAAVWASRNVVGHANWALQLLESEPGVVLPWLEEYDQLRALQASLAEGDARREGIEDLLPPLQEHTVLAHLEPGEHVQSFAERLVAEPRVTYLHQLRRELRGMHLANLYHDPWLGHLTALTSHASPEVRAMVWRAFTFAPADLIPRELARAAAHDPVSRLAEREAAFLAYSYCPHPAVFADLHQLAADPAAPLWSAAVSRLADLGTGFSLGLLDRIEADRLDLARRRLLDEGRAQIAAREAQPRDAASFAAGLATMLVRAAWADLACHPLETSLLPWTQEQVRARLGEPEVRAELARLAHDYTSPLEGEFGALQERVRSFAKEWGE